MLKITETETHYLQLSGIHYKFRISWFLIRIPDLLRMPVVGTGISQFISFYFHGDPRILRMPVPPEQLGTSSSRENRNENLDISRFLIRNPDFPENAGIVIKS